MSDDGYDLGATCYPLEEDCPACGFAMASNGYLDWCMQPGCGYSRKAVEAPLGSQNDDPDAVLAGAGVG